MLELINPGISTNNEADVIMFGDLSIEAQKKALEHLKIKNPSEKHYDVLPMAYVVSVFDFSTQSEIDDEALQQIGYYREAA